MYVPILAVRLREWRDVPPLFGFDTATWKKRL
jgi:hypothetical protein